MASPKPMPTALKILTGNRGKRPLNENEPKPKVKKLKPPEYLDKVAKKEWSRIAPILPDLYGGKYYIKWHRPYRL